MKTPAGSKQEKLANMKKETKTADLRNPVPPTSLASSKGRYGRGQRPRSGNTGRRRQMGDQGAATTKAYGVGNTALSKTIPNQSSGGNNGGGPEVHAALAGGTISLHLPVVDDEQEWKDVLKTVPPLDYFDSDEFETKSPSQWVESDRESGGTVAQTLWYTEGRRQWLPCNVISYDAASDHYDIRIKIPDSADLVPKRVKRLNLVFDTEDPALFERRRRWCRLKREEAKAKGNENFER